MESAIEFYTNKLKSFCPELTEGDLSFISSRLSIIELNNKDLYFSAGQIQKEVGFIIKGIIRSFYLDMNGNEKTVRFFSANEYVTHYSAFLTQQPSRYYFQCLEATILVSLTHEVMNSAYRQSSGFERYGRLVAEEILKMQQTRIESFLFLSAEQRYQQFIIDQPDLFNRVAVSHLCSYLGIERQSLTRIRKKLTQK